MTDVVRHLPLLACNAAVPDRYMRKATGNAALAEALGGSPAGTGLGRQGGGTGAEGGWPAWSLVGITLLGGTLSAGSANAVNMYVDRDIDALMARTQSRPLVTGVIEPRNALIFAIALQVLAFAVLWSGANLLSAVLAFGAAAFYVGVYTLWLKRTSRWYLVKYDPSTW